MNTFTYIKLLGLSPKPQNAVVIAYSAIWLVIAAAAGGGDDTIPIEEE